MKATDSLHRAQIEAAIATMEKVMRGDRPLIFLFAAIVRLKGVLDSEDSSLAESQERTRELLRDIEVWGSE